MRVLMCIPSVAKTGVEDAVLAGTHPTMDYYALAATLRSGGDTVEILDFAALDASRDPWVVLARKRFGGDAALAVAAYRRRREFDAVFTNSESIGIPLGLLWGRSGKRPWHVTIGHRLSTGKKHVFFKRLRAHHGIDMLLVYADLQYRIARERLGIPEQQLAHFDFHADTDFFRPRPVVAGDRPVVCAAGLEWRDYPTLIRAASRLPDIDFRLAAASPWSKHADETEKTPLPGNVDSRRYEYGALRDLYASSFAVAVPLYETDFQAGITSILEAMAMGKAVVVTRTSGQTDVVVDGVNGLVVPPGDPDAWVAALERLRDNPELRETLGANARDWVLRNASLEFWSKQVAGALRGSLPRRSPEIAKG
jgi:glycosyltransferase involved in cell wall biosynthesis